MHHTDRLERWLRNTPESGGIGAAGGTGAPDAAGLAALHAAWLMHVPFENVTKREAGAPRPPERFWREHDARGSGGTCYNATAACLELLGALGYAARPVFCALPRVGSTAHVALLVEVPEGVHLVDVGYALPRPLRLPERGMTRLATPWYDLELMVGPGDEFLLFTVDARGRRFRYAFRPRATGRANFNAAWRLTCAPGARYMRGLALGRARPDCRLIFRAPNAIYRLNRTEQTLETLAEVTAGALAERFDLPEALVAAGLAHARSGGAVSSQ